MSTRLVPMLWLGAVLRHPVTGVNALVGTVPRLPTWPATPPCEVYDELSDEWVIHQSLPESVLTEGIPALIVRRASPAEMDVLPGGNGYDEITYILHAITRVEAGGETNRRDAALIVEQLLRCARRVISIAMPEFVQPIYPELNGIEIGIPTTNMFTPLPPQAPIDGSLLHDGYLVRLAVHDAFALGVDVASTP